MSHFNIIPRNGQNPNWTPRWSVSIPKHTKTSRSSQVLPGDVLETHWPGHGCLCWSEWFDNGWGWFFLGISKHWRHLKDECKMTQDRHMCVSVLIQQGFPWCHSYFICIHLLVILRYFNLQYQTIICEIPWTPNHSNREADPPWASGPTSRNGAPNEAFTIHVLSPKFCWGRPWQAPDIFFCQASNFGRAKVEPWQNRDQFWGHG